MDGGESTKRTSMAREGKELDFADSEAKADTTPSIDKMFDYVPAERGSKSQYRVTRDCSNRVDLARKFRDASRVVILFWFSVT